MKKKLQSVMALFLLAGTVLTASAVKRPTEIHFRHLNGKDAFPNKIGSVFCHYDSVGHLDQLRYVCVFVMAGNAAQGELPKGDFDRIRPKKADLIQFSSRLFSDGYLITPIGPISH